MSSILTEYNEEKVMSDIASESFAEGKAEAERLNNLLTSKLIADGRTEDLLKATKDATFKESLYKEYKIR